MTVFIKAAIDDLVGVDLPKLKQDILAAVDHDRLGLQDICINGKNYRSRLTQMASIWRYFTNAW